MVAQAEWEAQNRMQEQLRAQFAGSAYHIVTYGCQMNANESQRLSGMLEAIGCCRCASVEEADIVFFNTCCVRGGAEERVQGNVGALRPLKEARPGMILGVCGCMMQQEGRAEAFMKRFPFVDIAFGTHDMHLLYDMLLRAKGGERATQVRHTDGEIVEGLPARRDEGPIASVTVMYGCNNFCSYCIVPYVRGRERSREPQAIYREVEQCVRDGAKEILLLGQNVNSYGVGLAEGANFPDLLRRLDKMEGLERIRFMTSHPKDLSDELIEAMAACDRVMPHLHLPVQSGSDAVLARMNRRYTAAHYEERVARLRARIPDISLTTDVIVGFPGESEADFQQTLALMERVRFRSAYTFIYSPRSGTAAARMDGAIPEPVKRERIERLIAAQQRITTEMLDAAVGQTFPVLVEGASARKEGFLTGHTPYGHAVNFPGNGHRIGEILPVAIVRNAVHTLAGEIVEAL